MLDSRTISKVKKRRYSQDETGMRDRYFREFGAKRRKDRKGKKRQAKSTNQREPGTFTTGKLGSCVLQFLLHPVLLMCLDKKRKEKEGKKIRAGACEYTQSLF